MNPAPPSHHRFTSVDDWEIAASKFLLDSGLSPNLSLLLTVSGGCDSIALLHFFIRNSGKFKTRKISVSHIDHGLRAESVMDGELVKEYCQNHDLTFFYDKLNPEKKSPDESVEMWGRRERYQIWERISEKTGSDLVLTAHHLDDLTESLLLRLERGTGFYGLGGIDFFRYPNILRPFLYWRKNILLQFLNHHGFQWREDETNRIMEYKRNWIRHKYLHSLASDKQFDRTKFTQSIVSISWNAKELLPKIKQLESGLLCRDKNHRLYLPRSIWVQACQEGWKDSVFGALREMINLESGIIGENPTHTRGAFQFSPFGESHWREFVRQNQSGKQIRVQLLNGWLTSNSMGFYWQKSVLEKRNSHTGKEIVWNWKKSIMEKMFSDRASHDFLWGERQWRISARLYSSAVLADFAKKIKKNYDSEGRFRSFFDAETFSSTLILRNRQEGDRFAPYGIPSRTRKLKRFFQDKKVSPMVRESVFLICCAETIAWVCGMGVSEFFKVKPNSRQILELVVECKIP